MNIFFLGTAAAEGYPGIFCNCDNCNRARALGGRNLRYRSSLLINRDLLVDIGPDLSAAAQRFGLNLSGVRTGLLTHGHSDHFFPMNLEMRAGAFSGGLELPTLDFFAPPDSIATLEKTFPNLDELSLRLHAVRPFERWQQAGYSFETFQAYHAIGHHDAQFYAITQGERSVLYATDTGSFPEATWAALQGKRFDVIILEETLGKTEDYDQHLGFNGFLAHAARMRAEGMLREGGRVIAHHFSHSGNPPYEELVAFFAPHGVEVAYDGLEINLD